MNLTAREFMGDVHREAGGGARSTTSPLHACGLPAPTHCRYKEEQ